MVDVDGAEFVSIDPFDSVLKNHNTTLDYGLLGLIKLINLQHACSKESLGISLPQNISSYTYQNHQLYISNISPFLIKKHSSWILPSKIESSQEVSLVSKLNRIMVNNFRQSSGTMHIFTSSNYSIFTIGYFDQDSGIFEPIGCTCYHFNPLVGTFIPFLVVESDFRKQGYASALIILLQALFNKNMHTSRVLVWGEFTDESKLMSFYRKLGFFPTIPSNYPLGFLLSSESIRGIRSVDDSKNFLLEVREPVSRRYEEGKVIANKTFLGKDFDKNGKLKPKTLQRLVNKEDSKCCVCEIQLGEHDAFVFCTAKCTTNQKFKMASPTATFEICGLILCLSCQSNFGLNTQGSACPLHDKSDPGNISIDSFNNHVSKEYTKLQSVLPDLKNYFNSCFEATSTSSVLGDIQQENSSFCIHCKTRECMKKNYDIDEGGESSIFARYHDLGKKASTMLPYLVQRSNHLSDVKEMRALGGESISKTCQHPIFLDANIGSSSSIFQNKLFGVKNVAAYGDCGFLSIYIAIVTSSEDLRQEYTTCFLTYIDQAMSYLNEKFPNRSDTLKNRLKEVKKDPLARRTSKRTIERGKRSDSAKKSVVDSPKKQILLSISHIRKSIFLAAVKSFVDKYEKVGQTFDLETPEIIAETRNFFQYMFNVGYLSEEDKEDPRSMKMACDEAINKLTTVDGKNRNNMFHRLYDLYGSDNTSSQWGLEVIYMDWELMKHLPEITQNRLGAAVVIDSEGTFLSNNSQFGNVHDTGFFRETGKHMLHDCDRFILIRFRDGEHYEIYYNRNTYEATFSTKYDAENPDFDPVRILLNCCNSQCYFALSGELKTASTSQNPLNNANNLLSDSEVRFFYENDFNPKEMRQIFATKNIQEFEKWSCYESLFELLFKEWFVSASKSLAENVAEKMETKDVLKERLKGMKKTDKIAVILFPFLFNDEIKFKYASIFLQKVDDEAFSILDMNGTSFTSLHLKQNEFFRLLYDITNTTVYTLDQLEVLAELKLIKFPDSSELDVFQRHILSLAYQWTRSQGSLYNSIFDLLGLPASGTLDGHECSYVLEVIENLLPKCTDNSTKRSLYILSIIFYVYMKDDENPIHTRLYKHFYMFGTDFSPTNRLDEYLQESISYMYLNQEDFFVSELAKIKKACKPSNADTWAKNMFETLWLPMKVFEKERYSRFSWLHYYVLINDIQMKTNLSQYFSERPTDDGGTEVIPFSMDPHRELMYECVKRLFSQKKMSLLAVPFVRYVEDRKLNRRNNVKINKELIVKELEKLKRVLQFYMGYIDCTDEYLVTRINDNQEQQTSKQSCTLENKTVWEINIQDNEIKRKTKNYEVIDLESKPQIGDEMAQEHQSHTKKEKKKIKERYKKEKLQRLFSHALVSSFQKYFTKKVSLQNKLRPFQNKEFLSIQEEVLPKLKSSANFIWHKESTDHYVIQSTDICINIGDTYKIDYMQMHDRLIKDRLDDEIMDAMIFLMMKEQHYLSENRSAGTNSSNPVALPCIFNTAIEDKQYLLASKIFRNSLKGLVRSDTQETVFLSHFDMLLIPINVTNDHWYLIVIDLKNLRCFALDSNHGYKIYDEKKELEPSPLEGARIEKCTQILSFLCLYGSSDMCKYLNENVDGFCYYNTNELVPLQEDSKSCGVFVLMNIYSILKYQRLTNILQANMVDDFRVFMFYTFSHFHKVNLDKTMIKNIAVDHSIFNRNQDSEIISRSEAQNIKDELQMINAYDERNHRNLEQLIKTTIRRRQKTTVIDISDTEDENDDKNDDNETDTESDVTENKSHAKEEEASKSKSIKNDQSTKKTTLRPGDIKRKESERLNIKSAHERNMEAKRRKESRQKEQRERRKTDSEIVALGSDLIDPKKKFKLEFKTRNHWLRENNDLYTQCENELERMTRMMKTKFIGYHKTERKFYLSSSTRANMYKNTMIGNLEIYRLHQEFIDSVQNDVTNGEAYRQLFSVTIPSYREDWYDMNEVPGNFFLKDLQTFYRNERAAYAFDKKDFTHLICKGNSIYGRIYSGKSLKQTMYHETKLSEAFIQKESYVRIAL